MFHYPRSLPFFRLSCAESNFSLARWRLHGNAPVNGASIVHKLSLWLTRFSCILVMDRKEALISLTVFETKNGNAFAHSVCAHLQHFQSPRSHAHALSSFSKSSVTQLDMTKTFFFSIELQHGTVHPNTIIAKSPNDWYHTYQYVVNWMVPTLLTNSHRPESLLLHFQ